MTETGVVTIVVIVVLSIVAFRLRHRFVRIVTSLPDVDLAANAPEAARFAHLLVTELKLYNLQEVEAVARGATPSVELVADIAASYAMYRERISAGEQGDHFSDAVLAVLAGGKRSVLAKLLPRSPAN